MPRTKKSVEEAMAEVLQKANAFTEAHKGESAEQILSEMRGEEQMMNDVVEARILEVTGNDWEPPHLEINVDEKVLIEKGLKDGDKVKLLIIKTEE